MAETMDAHGDVVARATEQRRAPGAAGRRSTRAIRRRVAAPRPTRARRPALAVVSAADPVDRATGRLVHLPDAPFLLGELSPADLLADLVDGPVLVDNDVNWAARAERAAAVEPPLDDFVYLHLGEGLGCAVVSRRRGPARAHRARRRDRPRPHPRPGRRAPCRSPRSSRALGLRRPGSTAIDVDALRRDDRHGRRALPHWRSLARAVGGVLAATVALADPEVVVVGGTWGSDPARPRGTHRHELRQLPRPVPVRAPRVTDHPPSSARATRLCTNSGTPSSTPPVGGRLNVEPERAATH